MSNILISALLAAIVVGIIFFRAASDAKAVREGRPKKIGLWGLIVDFVGVIFSGF